MAVVNPGNKKKRRKKRGGGSRRVCCLSSQTPTPGCRPIPPPLAPIDPSRGGEGTPGTLSSPSTLDPSSFTGGELNKRAGGRRNKEVESRGDKSGREVMRWTGRRRTSEETDRQTYRQVEEEEELLEGAGEEKRK